MTASRRNLVAVLCLLLAFGFFAAVQGCGKKQQQEERGAQQQQMQTTEKETAKPATEQAGETMTETAEHIHGYTCPMHPEASSLEPGKCPICGMDLVEADLIYTCPMHPDVHSLEPGKCPICGMELVLRPVPKHE